MKESFYDGDCGGEGRGRTKSGEEDSAIRELEKN